ncbi:FlgO family outer membrane protein [Gemmatimonadota bacterium]
MIGKTIDRYKIIDKLGEGGMGSVWKAEDTRLNRLVALKTLSPHLAENEEARERIVREAQAASAMNHPNITTVHDLLDFNDQHFICMEYVEGKTVQDLIESDRVGVKKAIDIILQAAKALDTAHGKGILHRDVKSTNIMVTTNGIVKVMDFGLAHLDDRSQLTRTGTTMGTLAYSSPEQLTGRPYDERSEIWSLGIVFYELLTGQLPFPGTSEGELVLAIINNELELPSNLYKDLPQSVEILVKQMLEKDPDRRFSCCQELINDLGVIQTSLSTNATIRYAKRSVYRVRSRPLVLSLIATVLLGVLGGYLLLKESRNLNADWFVVAPFENQTNNQDLDYLSNHICSEIISALSIEGINVVSRDDTKFVWDQIGLRMSSGELRYSPSQTLAIETGAGIIVSGTYSLDRETIQINVQISNAVTGRTEPGIENITSSKDEPDQAISEICDRIIGKFILEADRRHVSHAAPPEAAARLFGEAFNAYTTARTNEDFDDVITLAYEAFEKDTTYVQPLIYAGLSAINIHQGWGSRVADIVLLLRQHQGRLSEFEKDWLEVFESWQPQNGNPKGDNERRIRAMVRAVDKQPSSKAIYNAALYLHNANRSWEALDYFALIDPIQMPYYQGSLPYYFMASQAQHFTGSYRRELKTIRLAQKKLPHEYRSYLPYWEIRALAGLGRLRKVPALIEGYSLLQDDGAYGPARRLLDSGLELRSHGHRELAEFAFEQCLSWLELRAPQDTSDSRFLKARAHYSLEQWDKARSLFQSLQYDYPNSLNYNYYLGAIAVSQGDGSEVERRSRWLESLIDLNSSDKATLQRSVDARYALAKLAALSGNHDEAIRILSDILGSGILHRLTHVEVALESLIGLPEYDSMVRPIRPNR